MCSFLNSAPAHRFQVDGRGKGDQTFVSTDVRRGFLAANMLLARCQREHKTTPAVLVVGFAHEPARNLPRKLVACRKQANVWSTKRQRHTEGLTFGDHNVGATCAR